MILDFKVEKEKVFIDLNNYFVDVNEDLNIEINELFIIKIINEEKVDDMKNSIDENIIKIKNKLGFEENNKIIIFLIQK